MSLTTLYIDLNSYFASVEQNEQPGLRGRPVAVVPCMAETTCCIAASVQAKRFGIRTGTLVREAKALCPELELVEARHTLYIQTHHRIIRAVEGCLPVHGVHSIDEFSCRLAHGEREHTQAIALAGRVKAAIREQVGPVLTCSIGLAPNRFLAKVGTEMQKPDGLVVLDLPHLPAALWGLELMDLPGIGPRMLARLRARGVATVRRLCELSEHELEAVWGGIVGRRWWHWLRGHDLYEPPTRRRSIGHQHVLPPRLRDDEAARAVAVRLLHKAAARMRHAGCCARQLTVAAEVRGRGAWHTTAGLGAGCRDTLRLAALVGRMWDSRPRGTPIWVDVTLHDLVEDRLVPAPLFEHERARSRLADAIDALSAKYGRHAVYTASIHHVRDAAGGGIAFRNIPDLSLADRVE